MLESVRIPTAPWLAGFEAYLAGRDLSANTVASYAGDLAHFAAWFELQHHQALAPELVTELDVRHYRKHLSDSGRASATINRRLTALRKYAGWAVREGEISLDPTEGVRFVEKTRLAPKWLDASQVNALLRVVDRAPNQARSELKRRQALRDRALVWLMLHTGLRVSEVCALTLAELKLGERKGWVHVQAGKGNKQRDVPINELALRALRAWLAVRPHVEHDRVFTSGDGAPVQVRGVQHRLREIGAEAGLALTPHTLRHTCAKSLIDHGAGLEKVAAYLGHSNLNTTRRYCEPSAQDLEAISDALVGE